MKKQKTYKEFDIAKAAGLVERTQIEANKGVEPKKQTEWKIKLTIRFIIIQIPNILGIWSLETGGEASSIKQIRDTFDFVQQRAGTVTRILFDLCVEKHKSQKPDDPSSYPVLSLIPNMSDENLLLLGNMREKINFNGINYLDNEGLKKQIENGNAHKQLEENFEVVEVSGKDITVKDNKLFDY